VTSQYEATIGIEVHVQLTTNSKIFCTCSNTITHTPNSNICQICTGQPGSLPVFNEQVIIAAIKAGLATESTLAPISYFARKHYFYPDLPKGYQITQSNRPICSDGYVPIRLEDGTIKKVRLTRIHIEEDAGKNIHSGYGDTSLVDLNRAGTPLLEIVTEPDIANAYEAREYLKALRLIVQYLNICSGNMEDGAFRADTNISVRKKGQAQLGTKCELKNINSFKFISDAIEYEINRQITLLQAGEKVRQETRLWDTKEHKTFVMRSKEEAADYRYINDPDLPPVVVQQTVVNKIKAELPELPYEKFERLCKNNGLTPYEAEILVNDRELADYYEKAAVYTKSKQLINWILRDLMGLLKEQKSTLKECKIIPQTLAALIDMVDQGTINNRTAQEVFHIMATTGQDPVTIVKEKSLEQMDNSEELENLIKDIVIKNPEVAAEYKSGKERLFGFFVGQAMQKTKGKGNPRLITELLKKYLS
jgi:aspartyl-tRNA(Asn)/glutamyl-tRNA(Gln) amidotransferase subunit B